MTATSGKSSMNFAYVLAGILVLGLLVIWGTQGREGGGAFGFGTGTNSTSASQASADLRELIAGKGIDGLRFANGGDVIYYDFTKRNMSLDEYATACGFIKDELGGNYAGFDLRSRSVQTSYGGIDIYGCPSQHTVLVSYLKDVESSQLENISSISFRNGIEIYTKNCSPWSESCPQEVGRDAARVLASWMYGIPNYSSRDEEWRRDDELKDVRILTKVSRDPLTASEREGRKRGGAEFSQVTVRGANVNLAVVQDNEPLLGDMMELAHKKMSESRGGEYDPYLFMAVNLYYEQLMPLSLLNESELEESDICDIVRDQDPEVDELARKHGLESRAKEQKWWCERNGDG